MKKITLLALTAGAIISVAGPASAQGIYLDLGRMDRARRSLQTVPGLLELLLPRR